MTTVCAAQLTAQAVSVQLKVRESKLFGLKGERFARFELSNEKHALPLSSDNVNGGQYYFFRFLPVGDWVIDADFVLEELPKLVLIQNVQNFQIKRTGDILTDSAGSSIVVGYSRDLRIDMPFTVQFGLDGSASKSDLSVPQEYWPGYSALVTSLKGAADDVSGKKYKEAIAVYERLMRADSLLIFPQTKDLASRRSHCFDGVIDEMWSSFLVATHSPSSLPKEKISIIDVLTPQARFVIDSLPSIPLKVSATDSLVAPILSRAKNILVRIESTRDSLQRAQDDLTVRWISEGAAIGKNGPQFERMIEVLAWAFSSLDFADTTPHALSVSIPPEIQAQLQKNNLQESYDIFIRQAGERHQNGLALFPAGFLSNLQKDTASFSLPYYSMLKAVQDYMSRSFPGALASIHSVFQTCYDLELSRRFDQMRVLINLRQRGVNPEVMKLLEEAAKAEKSGDKDAASERYTTALRLSPDLAYAAYLCGRLYARTGDPIRARSFFERACELDTSYLSAYREAWTLYQAVGNYKGMAGVVTQAIARGNDFWETNIYLGIADLGEGNLPQATKQFERALQFSPNNYQTTVQLGLAYQAAKDFQKARDYFNKAIFIDPHRMEAVEFLQKLDEIQKAER
jgi:tetratricopeptide (TPR) repeat protein